MTALRTAAQQALEALEQSETFVPYEGFGMARKEAERKHQAAITALRAALRAALAQEQAEPLNLRDPAVQKRLASQWGYVPAAAQAEPVEPVGAAGLFTLAHLWAQQCYFKGLGRPCDIDSARGAFEQALKAYTAPPQRKPLTEKEMYAVEEEARKNFRLSQKGPRGQQITYWDGLTPWLIRAVEKASWEKNK